MTAEVVHDAARRTVSCSGDKEYLKEKRPVNARVDHARVDHPARSGSSRKKIGHPGRRLDGEGKARARGQKSKAVGSGRRTLLPGCQIQFVPPARRDASRAIGPRSGCM